MKVLFVGDIVGKPGRSALRAHLPSLVLKHELELVIVNAENSAAGFGITEKVGDEIFSMGTHVITSGNHIWDKKEALKYLEKEKKVLRPINYPPGVPGFGSIIYQTKSGARVGVINVSGRVFMPALDCPFRAVEAELEEMKGKTDLIIVDIHAEATSEKIAMGLYFDGKVSAMLGTHTHVQTADERVLPRGTAYITDVGMSGPLDSVIGVQKEIIFQRFLTALPIRFEIASGVGELNGVVMDFDVSSGKAVSIERISLSH